MSDDPPGPFDEAPCGLFEARDDGRLLRVNRYLAQLVNARPEALVGTYLDRLLSRASGALYHASAAPVLKQRGTLEQLELTLERSDGRRFSALFNGRRTLDPDGSGRVHGALFVLRERQELEERLVQAQRVIEQLPGVVFQLVLRRDGSSAMPYASQGIAHLLGISPAAVWSSAEPLWARIHPDDRSHVRAGLRAAQTALSPWNARFRARDGELRWIETLATPQLLPDGSVVFHGYAHDATDQVRLEEAQRERLAAQRASEAKTQFLGRLSHELRNPLTCILGFASLLSMHVQSESPQYRQLLQNLEQAGNHLLALVDELLDISRIESGRERLELQDVVLRTVVSQAHELLAPMAQLHRVELEISVPPELVVRADPRRLLQVAMNLFSNAIKYNRMGGKVYVEAARDVDGVRMSVRDEGKGMSSQQLEELFQPFRRLGQEQVQGTGLGLVITRALLDHMGGSIEVSSIPGVGSCFSILLKSAEPTLARPSDAEDVRCV